MNIFRGIVELLLFVFVAGAIVTLLRTQARVAKERAAQARQVKDEASRNS